MTGGACPPLRRPPEPLSLLHLRLAVGPGQGPGDYVRRVLELTVADRAEVAVGPPPLGLDGLHGTLLRVIRQAPDVVEEALAA